jgi:hypothetical protein
MSTGRPSAMNVGIGDMSHVPNSRVLCNQQRETSQRDGYSYTSVHHEKPRAVAYSVSCFEVQTEPLTLLLFSDLR